MKPFFASLLMLFLTQNMCAQISGTFITANQKPVPYASVLLLNSRDSTLVKGVLTDDLGNFSISHSLHGNYLLRFSSIGYGLWHSETFGLDDSQSMKNFGQLIVSDDTQQLGEVLVRGEKPLFEQRADGTVINIENSVLTKGSSALAVLERAPGVIVDHRNNGIALNGKDGVMVMINGKVIRMPLAQVVVLLEGMSANDIEKIELLTTPPSRYDADGNAGLINILMKKNNVKGTNGGITLTAGYGRGEKGTGSFNLNRNSEKIDIYGSYQFSRNRTYSDMYIVSGQNMPVFGGDLTVTAWDTTKLLQNNHSVTVGFDSRLNQKISAGGSVNYNKNNTSSSNFNHAEYLLFPDSLLFLRARISGINRWENVISTAYLEKEIREDEKLTLNTDYLYFANDNPSQIQSFLQNTNGTKAGNNDSLFAPEQQGFANTSIRVGVLKMDYVKKINKTLALETGVKGTFTKGQSLSGIESWIDGQWVRRGETSNQINFRENIAAMYAALNAQINPSVNLSAGLRFEYAHSRMNDPKTTENTANRKLGALFPNILFSKKLNDNSELMLSYSKRISRPAYNDLASYVAYSDPTAVYTGNPTLKSTITHNLKAGYNYRGYSFSLLFSRDKNPIVRYQITERPAANLLYISPQNLAYQNNLTFQTSIPVSVNNWWTLNYGFTGGLRQFKVEHTRKPAEKTYFGYSLNFSQTFKLPQNFDIEISGWYNSLSYNGSIRVDGFGTMNGGIKKELKNNAGSLQLSVADILKSFQINTRYGTITEEAFNIKNHVQINTESRKTPVFKLTYSRSFGGNIKSRKTANSGSADERDRIRKD